MERALVIQGSELNPNSVRLASSLPQVEVEIVDHVNNASTKEYSVVIIDDEKYIDEVSCLSIGRLFIKDSPSVKVALMMAGYVDLRVEKDGFISCCLSKPGVDSVKLDRSIDEDSLLLDEDKAKQNTEACGDGNSASKTTKKRACKNCTCGLAEKEATSGKVDTNMASKSSCGNCSLGDAFRCAGCPYRGLPAFKPGDKITLPNDFLADDI